mmetsp:Transcript_10556/g.39274  ORF Transcript_10556/g.39274 Transcript_10556/m.39274 type:complete len:315 (+) Transcript_10556:562-1506(+)
MALGGRMECNSEDLIHKWIRFLSNCLAHLGEGSHSHHTIINGIVIDILHELRKNLLELSHKWWSNTSCNLVNQIGYCVDEHNVMISILLFFELCGVALPLLPEECNNGRVELTEMSLYSNPPNILAHGSNRFTHTSNSFCVVVLVHASNVQLHEGIHNLLHVLVWKWNLHRFWNDTANNRLESNHDLSSYVIVKVFDIAAQQLERWLKVWIEFHSNRSCNSSQSQNGSSLLINETGVHIECIVAIECKVLLVLTIFLLAKQIVFPICILPIRLLDHSQNGAHNSVEEWLELHFENVGNMSEKVERVLTQFVSIW